MPIKRETFEKGNFKKRHTDRSNHPVAHLLSKNTGLAYTVKEICNLVRMKEDTVRSMLYSLKQDELIVHKAPYFAWKQKAGNNTTKKPTKKRR